MAEDKPLKKPFTDEQQDFLMDYLFEKYMNDMMKSKERSEDFYNQPPTTDPEGNILMQASLPGNFNKRETELLMGESPMKKTLPGNLNKNELEMLMGLIDQGVKDTKKEGIMMARDDRIGTLMNLLEAERMSDNPDLDKIREYEGELFNLMSPRKAADGGIVSLAGGGDPADEIPLKKTIKTPSTYGKRVFEDFLFDAGFVKIDPDTGKPRGSKGDFNKYLLKKGIKPGSAAGTTELNKILKKLNKPMYISLEMAQGGKGLSLAEEATGTKKGSVGAADRNNVFKGVDEIRTKANKMDFKNTDQKYNFIKKEIKKKFPAIAAGTLATLAKGTALGMGLEMFMPQELQAATLYSPEDMDKMLGEMAIREKFE